MVSNMPVLPPIAELPGGFIQLLNEKDEQTGTKVCIHKKKELCTLHVDQGYGKDARQCVVTPKELLGAVERTSHLLAHKPSFV